MILNRTDKNSTKQNGKQRKRTDQELKEQNRTAQIR